MRLKRSKLSHFQTDRLLEHFVAGTPARTVALLVGVNRNTVNLFYMKLRSVIDENLCEEIEQFEGDVEVDESYFGGVRKGKRGRVAAGKVAVFGLLKRGGHIYTIDVKDPKRTRSFPSSLVKYSLIACYTDCYHSYGQIDRCHQFPSHADQLFEVVC